MTFSQPPLQSPHHHLLVKILGQRLQVPPRAQLDRAELAHSYIPRETRPPRLARPIIQVRVRRAEPGDLVLAEHSHRRLFAIRTAREFHRHPAELVLADLNTAIRERGLLSLLRGGGGGGGGGGLHERV